MTKFNKKEWILRPLAVVALSALLGTSGVVLAETTASAPNSNAASIKADLPWTGAIAFDTTVQITGVNVADFDAAIKAAGPKIAEQVKLGKRVMVSMSGPRTGSPVQLTGENVRDLVAELPGAPGGATGHRGDWVYFQSKAGVQLTTEAASEMKRLGVGVALGEDAFAENFKAAAGAGLDGSYTFAKPAQALAFVDGVKAASPDALETANWNFAGSDVGTVARGIGLARIRVQALNYELPLRVTTETAALVGATAGNATGAFGVDLSQAGEKSLNNAVNGLYTGFKANSGSDSFAPTFSFMPPQSPNAKVAWMMKLLASYVGGVPQNMTPVFSTNAKGFTPEMALKVYQNTGRQAGYVLASTSSGNLQGWQNTVEAGKIGAFVTGTQFSSSDQANQFKKEAISGGGTAYYQALANGKVVVAFARDKDALDDTFSALDKVSYPYPARGEQIWGTPGGFTGGKTVAPTNLLPSVKPNLLGSTRQQEQVATLDRKVAASNADFIKRTTGFIATGHTVQGCTYCYVRSASESRGVANGSNIAPLSPLTPSAGQ